MELRNSFLIEGIVKLDVWQHLPGWAKQIT
jgi:hypothetical protein